MSQKQPNDLKVLPLIEIIQMLILIYRRLFKRSKNETTTNEQK